MDELEQALRRIDGRQYGAYKDLPRDAGGARLRLRIDHVQGDPFAAPSRLALRVPLGRAGWPAETLADPERALALRDLLARRLAVVCRDASRSRGSGKSGVVTSDAPGQQILDTTAVTLSADAVEARIRVGLPAQGRRVRGREAAALLLETLPALAEDVLLASSWDPDQVEAHLDAYVDHCALVREVEAREWVGFVAEDSLLPRASGVDDQPLEGGLRFMAPEALRETVELPHAGTVHGMALPRGVTLIVGGGYHGKSTLL
ncbi:MAG: hypothetical protein KDA24_13565, partial [Deltaproteobacteria bacterium]|nr:hypothetical protein [Deltaproteobacteria bacterium]